MLLLHLLENVDGLVRLHLKATQADLGFPGIQISTDK